MNASSFEAIVKQPDRQKRVLVTGASREHRWSKAQSLPSRKKMFVFTRDCSALAVSKQISNLWFIIQSWTAWFDQCTWTVQARRRAKRGQWANLPKYITMLTVGYVSKWSRDTSVWWKTWILNQRQYCSSFSTVLWLMYASAWRVLRIVCF
jgi:hypothetical protein